MTTATTTKTVAIYCRKSTEEGLDQAFNSLDAQRQTCEHFVASQTHDGWEISPTRYDDGGFSGSNTQRPALTQLIADINAGLVQVVAVYKLDRLSRSLTDFVDLLRVLDKHNVAFVSVTQHFNTATPMGRLMLNILICFAQFERENMIERVRDKVAAAKRLGRWCGGRPVLGYDVAPGGGKLLVNDFEAERVQAIFQLYLDCGSLSLTVQELAKRGWTTKAWTTEKGKLAGGKAFAKSTLAKMLSNILYTGRVRYREEIYPGEHPAIIDEKLFHQVQQYLAQQKRTGGPTARVKHHVLLRGILRCGHCDCGMTYTYTKRKNKLYGYYTCIRSRERGAHTCPMPSVPAGEIEALVVQEIKAIAQSPDLIDQVLSEAVRQHQATIAELETRLAEAEALAAQATKVAERTPDDPTQAGLVRQAEAQLTTLRQSLQSVKASAPNKKLAHQALKRFDPVWAELSPKERCQLLQSLVNHITLDGHNGTLSFAFHSEGIAALATHEATP